MNTDQIDQSIILNCHKLLQSVLMDAFKVPVLLFTPPYRDITQIDQGIRAAVWTHYYEGNEGLTFGESTHQYRILIIKSNLGFYNVIFLLGQGSQPNFVSLGPFRDEELSPSYFTQILKESHIAPADIQNMKSLYERMPLVQLDTVINVARHIVTNFIPEFRDLSPELIQYSEQDRAVEINRDMIEHYSIEHAEDYRETLSTFLSQLKTGDNTNAKRSLLDFLDRTNLAGSKSMHTYKSILQGVNSYCHLTLLQLSIHPLHVIKLAESIRLKIDHTASLSKLEQLPGEITRKYCLLIRNYAHPETSRMTRDVITYIQLHLEDELSLSRLADYFQKNPSVLSNNFRKETGLTLTHFIQQTRIQEAIRLFNTTDMSVSEVALAVGYQDFSYFSKVFTRQVGYSPRKYKLCSVKK